MEFTLESFFQFSEPRPVNNMTIYTFNEDELFKILVSVCEQLESEYPALVLQIISEFGAFSFLFRTDSIGNGPHLNICENNCCVKCVNPIHSPCLQLLDVEIDSTHNGSWRWQYSLTKYRSGSRVCMGFVLKPEKDQHLYKMNNFALNQYDNRERNPYEYKTICIYDFVVGFSSGLRGDVQYVRTAFRGKALPATGDKILFAMEQDKTGNKYRCMRLYVFHVNDDGLNHVIYNGSVADGIYIPALTFYQNDSVKIETFGENVDEVAMMEIRKFLTRG